MKPTVQIGTGITVTSSHDKLYRCIIMHAITTGSDSEALHKNAAATTVFVFVFD